MVKKLIPIISIGLMVITSSLWGQTPSIELIGQYIDKPAYDLKVRGDYAYVTGLNTRQFYILDISNPENPALAGTYTSTANEVREVALIGDYAYIACSWDGFEVIDISDPSLPAKVGPTHSGSGVAVAFEFSKGYGFLANRESGIRVYDVSDPANPVYVTTYSTSTSYAWASSITIDGNYLYIGIEHSPNGFEVFDISNPAVQNRVATISGTNSVFGIAKEGNYVYHSGQWENEFHTVDVSNPASPVRVGSGFPTHGDAWGIAISGNLAFLGERSYGLQILDISNPSNPTLLDEYATGGDPHWGIQVAGDYVYLADGSGGVKILSTTGQSQPEGWQFLWGDWGWEGDLLCQRDYTVSPTGNQTFAWHPRAGSDFDTTISFVIDAINPNVDHGAGYDVRIGIIANTEGGIVGDDRKWSLIVSDRGVLQLLEENVAYRASIPFTPVEGIQYNMQMQIAGNTVNGKIWIDGESEPDWMVTDNFAGPYNKYGVGVYAEGTNVCFFSYESQPPTNSPPVVIFTAENAWNSTVFFNVGSSYDADGIIETYELDADGDGTYDKTFLPSDLISGMCAYNYGFGPHVVNPKMRVTDDDGANSTASIEIILTSFSHGTDNYHFVNNWYPYDGVFGYYDQYFNFFFADFMGIFRDWIYQKLLLPGIGFCSGMASTSCNYFVNPSSKPPVNGNVYEWSKYNELVQSEIARYHLVFNAQNIFPNRDYMISDNAAISGQLLQLTNYLSNDNPMIFHLGWDGKIIDHCVTATDLIINNANDIRVLCYDPNYPANEGIFIFTNQNNNWSVINDSYQNEGTINRLRFYEETAGVGPIDIWGIYSYLVESLGELASELKARIIISCPVDVLLIDEDGNQLGIRDEQSFNEIVNGSFVSDSGVWIFYVPSLNQYNLWIYGKDLDSAHVSLLIPSGYDTIDLSSFVLPLTNTSSALIEFGQGKRDTVALVDLNGDGIFEGTIQASDWSWQTNVATMLTHGSLSGTVANDGIGITGVTMDLYDSLGVLVTTDATAEDGHYDFGALENGHYVVAIVTPLGYNSDEESRQIRVMGLNHRCNFTLTPLDIIPHQRGRGYWMHQVNALLLGKGNPQETYESMCEYMELVRTHFNQHGLNPVNVFSVDLGSDCDQRLEALRAVISPRPKSSMKDKAKAHLTALLLNMVSGKIAQWAIISEDSATVSQAITYCNDLIADGLEENDEIAMDIAEMINEGQIVPAYWIDPETPDYAYRSKNNQQIPSEYSVGPNYPNPFNPLTEINFGLPEASHVEILIFNVLGQQVVKLIDSDYPAGEHKIVWNGQDDNGEPVSSGMYFYKIKAGKFINTRKMVLLK